MSESLTIKSVRVRVYRCPLDSPVQTSFGTMHDRPMVLVSVTTPSGETGWGEIWCNFPAVGAEHRARLVDSVLAPLLSGKTFDGPEHAYEHMVAATRILAIQSAEPGPFAQAIAGLDIALWDLAGRQSGQPLWKLLGGGAPRIPVYASGLNPTAPEKLAWQRYEDGFRAFKLKIGFDLARDVANLESLRATLGEDAELMVDANQAWSLNAAMQAVPNLERFRLAWLEEPLAADRPWSEWDALRSRTSIPLAGGENLAGNNAFDTALKENTLSIVQPDVAKWGGITECLPLARRILKANKRYCPHYLGGGIGLLASAHLLAAAGGDGALEIDSNPNPLRGLLCGRLTDIDEGFATLTQEPGLGVAPDLETLQSYAVSH